eukprot:gene6864-12463_t
MEADYERVLCVKSECFVYHIPPRATSRGYRAADWKLDQPDWTGRLRIVTLSGQCFIKFEDKISGELFAQAPVHEYPGVEVEAVTDSSRYFVVKIVDPSGKHAFIGMGFNDRGDSFDFNVTLQDHFKREKTSKALEDTVTDAPKLDLGFKDGQTIKINIGQKTGSPKPRPKAANSGIGILPPPPGQKVPSLTPPPGSSFPVRQQQQPQSQQTQSQQPQPQLQKQSEEWGDFSSSRFVSSP